MSLDGFSFNPRSREGSDLRTIWWGIVLSRFQSALPRGERRGVGVVLWILGSFNPRSREGSDTLAFVM